jgi:hypothetical protein
LGRTRKQARARESHQAVGSNRQLLHASDHLAVDGFDDIAYAHLSAVSRRALLQDFGDRNLAHAVERHRDAERREAGRRRPVPLAHEREAGLQVLLGHHQPGGHYRLHLAPPLHKLDPLAKDVWERATYENPIFAGLNKILRDPPLYF